VAYYSEKVMSQAVESSVGIADRIYSPRNIVAGDEATPKKITG
jgi:hypothetical protein